MAGQHPAGLQCALGERSSYHYRGRRADQADLKKRVKEIASDTGALWISPGRQAIAGNRRKATHPRLARQEGWDVNAKRIYRLYKEMGLQLPHRPPKQRVKAKPREGRCVASCSNEVWAHGLCP